MIDTLLASPAKRVAAVHDISGVGKCSLTAALPVISAAGVECLPVPTAVLSTHTGDIAGYTFHDLTDDIPAYLSHWLQFGITLDCIYSGYLGSVRQIDMVLAMADEFSFCRPLLVVDPAMADSGRLYVGFDSAFVCEMKRLCKRADILVPNLTEACLLTGIEYKESVSADYIETVCRALSKICDTFVLTGVSLDDSKAGCLVSEGNGSELRFIETEKFPGVYYGTGDLFASALTGAIMNGKSLYDSAETATEFVVSAIRDTYLEGSDTRLGVAFERHLPEYIKNVRN